MKYVNLAEVQVKEAKALYLHLLNHSEVQNSPVNPGMPMCKICGMTAKEILDDEKYHEYIISMEEFKEKFPGIKGKIYSVQQTDPSLENEIRVLVLTRESKSRGIK